MELFKREVECELCGAQINKKEAEKIFGKKYCRKCYDLLQSMVRGQFRCSGKVSDISQKAYDFILSHPNKSYTVTEETDGKETTGKIIGILDDQLVVLYHKELKLYKFPEAFQNTALLRINNPQLDALANGREIPEDGFFTKISDKAKHFVGTHKPHMVGAAAVLAAVALGVVAVTDNSGRTPLSEKAVTPSDTVLTESYSSETETEEDTIAFSVIEDDTSSEEDVIDRGVVLTEDTITEPSTQETTTKETTTATTTTTTKKATTTKKPTTTKKVTTTKRLTTTKRVTTTRIHTTKKIPTTRQTTTEEVRREISISEYENTYLLNIDSHVYHRPNCRTTTNMLEINKQYFTGTKSEIERQGYRACGVCHP